MSEAIGGPTPGTTLAGKYLVEKTLGVGGMGVVVSAMHLQLDQRVALKYLLPDALKNPEVVERFAREAKAAAKIRGEHVARVIDVGRFDDGSPYMVMEYLEGHDLGRQLELHGALPIADAVRYVIETCEALAEAHAAKIVHRDLKPSNLFLAKQPDKSAIIKVLDFGISKTGDAASAALTKTSALMGTAYYMSPEQMTAPKDVDHRSDIWALGVILYELLAGHQPFRGETVAEIIAGILQNQPEPLRTVRPDVPEGLAQVVAKCMQSRAADRWGDVGDLAEALAGFGEDADRKSVVGISRVLGKSTRPPATTPAAGLSKATMIVPTPAAALTPIASTPAVTQPAAAAVSSSTTHGLTHSSVGLGAQKKTSPLVWLAVVGALAVGGVGTAALLRKTQTADAKDTHVGVVAPPPSEAPAPPNALTPSPLPVATNAGATNAGAASTNAGAMTPPPVTPGGAHPPLGTPAVQPVVARPNGAPPVASAPPPVASAPPAASTPPAASVPPKTNPLEIKIK